MYIYIYICIYIYAVSALFEVFKFLLFLRLTSMQLENLSSTGCPRINTTPRKT